MHRRGLRCMERVRLAMGAAVLLLLNSCLQAGRLVGMPYNV